MDVIGPVSNGELLCLCAYAATALVVAFLFNRKGWL